MVSSRVLSFLLHILLWIREDGTLSPALNERFAHRYHGFYFSHGWTWDGDRARPRV